MLELVSELLCEALAEPALVEADAEEVSVLLVCVVVLILVAVLPVVVCAYASGAAKKIANMSANAE